MIAIISFAFCVTRAFCRLKSLVVYNAVYMSTTKILFVSLISIFVHIPLPNRRENWDVDDGKQHGARKRGLAGFRPNRGCHSQIFHFRRFQIPSSCMPTGARSSVHRELGDNTLVRNGPRMHVWTYHTPKLKFFDPQKDWLNRNRVWNRCWNCSRGSCRSKPLASMFFSRHLRRISLPHGTKRYPCQVT